MVKKKTITITEKGRKFKSENLEESHISMIVEYGIINTILMGIIFLASIIFFVGLGIHNGETIEVMSYGSYLHMYVFISMLLVGIMVLISMLFGIAVLINYLTSTEKYRVEEIK